MPLTADQAGSPLHYFSQVSLRKGNTEDAISGLDSVHPVDLTVSHRSRNQNLPPLKRYWRTRSVRRNHTQLNELGELENQLLPARSLSRLNTTTNSGESDFTYISGPKYFFQQLVRQYPLAAFFVWTFLFLVELSMVLLYLIQSTMSYDVTWMHYDTQERSGWFYARTLLSVISLVQLFFAYSLSVMTITVVLITSIYQIIIFFVSIPSNLAWVSCLYVPYFMRCWPMRQYFLFILDSVALMMPRNRKLDLLRLAAGPLTLFICMVFSASGVFRIDQCFQGYPINMAVSIYFVVVTVSTVGFGDVTPQTQDGKAITIVIIFIFIAKMPTFIRVIRSTAKILKAYRSYTGRRNHFIVYGHLNREEVVSILDEVFCLYPMKSVCFCSKWFAPDVLSIGRHPTYRLRSTFLIVDTLDSFALRRMKAQDASAIIILPIREGYSSRVDDDVMLAAIIFERFVPKVPQYVWLRYGLHAKLLKGQRSCVIDEHIKKNIMASALLLPGIVPFLVNLVRSAWAEGVEPADLWTENGIEQWKSQYEYSRRNVLSTCLVPLRFVGATLGRVVANFKYRDVLIVGVEENERRVMRFDLNYRLEEQDVLMAVYERTRNSLSRALEEFSSPGPVNEAAGETYGANFCQGLNSEELLHTNMNSSFVFYPYKSSASLCDMVPPQTPATSDGADTADKGDGHIDSKPEDEALSLEEVRRALMNIAGIVRAPRGIPLASLQLRRRTAAHLWHLTQRHRGLLLDLSMPVEDREEALRDVTDQINSSVLKAADMYLAAMSEQDRQAMELKHQDEVFLFIDQTSSILRKTTTSVYEDVISQTIAQYELYVMMQCICAVHAHSRLTLLTLRRYPPHFFQTWKDTFGTPLRYIRGQGSLDSHLNYALTVDTDVTKVRGILLYCSQMGPRDFGDIPIFSVENSVLDLLEWNEQTRDGLSGAREQNIVVELQSFLFSIKVSPFHTDAVWRTRGESNFQDALAFMMGRFFASNMLITILIHSHRDSRIIKFFEMVLNLTSTANMFDKAVWANRSAQSQTLFKLCGNHSLRFQTFGDAFEFLLSKRQCVAIGVFRLFPASEMLSGMPRYFVTNPPMCMPLLMEDIIYCLDGSLRVACE
ncbi:Ion channel/Calcium-activated BK potassium channel alpha subunit, putative [Leishmania lindenbergi]|uniref:Ion channel/Calcium-activated BK potassium channel alpha subunit n=1 Tax=Leishmania lindenbergi TaxID=651832 RepID=A0AAW3AJQ2_9TRYP